jgi:16S rRNA (guanine966-N2)-methyltransferase
VRIISGHLKGRRLHSFSGSNVRPTADRVREALFSILAQTPFDAAVLDLFAGTGALGIEAISRGAKSAVFIDKNAASIALIRKNIEHCRLADTTRVIRWNADANLDCLRAYPAAFNLVFMDPPYGKNLVPITLRHLLACGCLSPDATIIAEHEPDTTPEPPSTHFQIEDHRRYGKCCLSFYRFQPIAP